MELSEFLAKRLDEDEAVAMRAARPESWVKPQPSRPDWYVQFWADEQDRAAVVADPESSAYPIVTTLGYGGDDEVNEELAEGRVEHIARHDPARVLREVAAKRELLAQTAEMRNLASSTEVWFLLDMADNIERQLAVPYVESPEFEPAWRVE